MDNYSGNLWNKLRSNKLTQLCIVVLGLYIITALFAYVLAPDNTTEANEQLSELALHPAGTRIEVLQLKGQEEQKENWGMVLLRGSKAHHGFLPVTAYSVAGDSVSVKHYSGINPFTRVVLPEKNEKYSRDNFEIRKRNVPVQSIKKYPLGTDGYGRCMLSRVIIGSRISMTVGILAVIISLTIGILIGLLAGYAGGKTDDLLMLLINTIWSVPTLLLVFAIVMAMGRGMQIIYLAVGLTLWVDVARIVRGQVLSLKENVYIDAARSLGFGSTRILSRHILPNILGPIWVVATGNFATAIILEAGLSYLGFGIQPPMPSWGNMLNENYGYALSGNYLLALIPSAAIVILVLCVNIIGNALRDAYDVKID